MVTKLKHCLRLGNNAVVSGRNLSLQRTLEMERSGCPKTLWSHPQQMHHLPENHKTRIGGRVTPRWFSMNTFRPGKSLPRPGGKLYTTQLYSYSNFIPVSLSLFIHSVDCLTTKPQPLPNRVLHSERSGASSSMDQKFRATVCHQNSFRKEDSRLQGYDALSSGNCLSTFRSSIQYPSYFLTGLHYKLELHQQCSANLKSRLLPQC